MDPNGCGGKDLHLRSPAYEAGEITTSLPRNKKNGAHNKIRTRDLLITNQLLYQLSYVGKYGAG